MKRELIKFITAIGLTLLGSALVLGVLVGMLFIFPDLSIFGAKAVKERDTQIVYRDDILDDAFANGKFILESTGPRIEVKMSNAGYEGEGTIVVNEAAMGIAFNSLSRTLVQWTQTMYDGELYYRIKVLEPTGLVFSDREKPTTIYINLPHRDSTDAFKHDFVLQNGYSNVNFSFVDNTAGSNDALRIGDLVVESAGSVNIPSSENISVKNVELKGRSLDFTCQSIVTGDVTVSGASGSQTFNATIGGDILINGENNKFSGDYASNVVFDSLNGSLNMNKVESLKVNTYEASIQVGVVTNGVVANTVVGNVGINKISAGGLTFTAGSKEVPNATASLAVGNLNGDVVVKNYGTGAITLNNVNGNVDVDSSQAGANGINISFNSAAEDCSVKVLGYDGDINVSGINGHADIEVLNWKNGAGAANVYAHFYQVVGDKNSIKTGGYINGHHDWGNVTIALSNGCNNFDLYVYGASSANSSAKYGFTNNNMYIVSDSNQEKANQIKNGSILPSSGVVKVHCKQSVYLQ